jgi:acetyltransferase-like isoleucine patch superfamily enzyme
MKEFISFLTRGRSWTAYSRFMQGSTRLIYGVEMPGRPRVTGDLSLTLGSSARPSLVFGKDVQLLGAIDLRTRDEARLILGDRVKLDGPVRLVAAGRGTISVGDDTRITCFTIINGGGDVSIGSGVVIGPRCSINANEHRFRGDTPIISSGFDHVSIHIGDDVWLGSDVAVLPGADIAKGTVVGANSVVTCATEPYSIYVGSPARKVGERHSDAR